MDASTATASIIECEVALTDMCCSTACCWLPGAAYADINNRDELSSSSVDARVECASYVELVAILIHEAASVRSDEAPVGVAGLLLSPDINALQNNMLKLGFFAPNRSPGQLQSLCKKCICMSKTRHNISHAICQALTNDKYSLSLACTGRNHDLPDWRCLMMTILKF